MQVAHVALNRALTADYTHRHMRFLAMACREQMAASVMAAQVRFEACEQVHRGGAVARGCVQWAVQSERDEDAAEHRVYEVLGR